MPYSAESIDEMARALPRTLSDVNNLLVRHAQLAESFDGGVKEHLLHGAGRRLNVIRRCIERLFQVFPPQRTRKLDDGELGDVQLMLQALCMNVAGIFDNWGWAFALRHGLLDLIGGPHGASLFKQRIRKFLPEPLLRQVEAMDDWHTNYLKGYRDSLAHQIPLYIPPFTVTKDEEVRYRELESERQQLLFAGEFDRYESATQELEAIGSACTVFMHSLQFEGVYRPVHLHPQILSDCATVVECGGLFLSHWQERA